jgi:hypothetical protein
MLHGIKIDNFCSFKENSMILSAYLAGITGKKMSWGISENRMPRGPGVLFSEMPSRFFAW